jgi:HK97 family phage major capsid protein
MNNPFLASLHEKRNQKADLIDATLNRAAEEDRDITEVEASNVQALAKEIEALDARISQVTDIETRKAEAAELARKVEGTATAETRSAGGWKVTREERTYHPKSDNSFVRDAFAATILGDFEAQQRIARHQQEEKIEKRDVTSAAFAGLVVPQFLTDLAAPFARAGRPFMDVSRKHALPASGLTISISKVTTGSAVAVQTEGSAVQETNMDDTKLDITVNTIAGQQNVSRQALERGTGIDALVMADLVSAYHTKLDAEYVTTNAASLTNVITQVVTYTSASPTVAELYPKIMDGIQRIQTNYFGGPNFILMHPRRLAFILAALDQNDRPLALPTSNGPQNAFSVGDGSVMYGNSGYTIAGLPVITDANVITTNGTGTNEDVIIIGNTQESHLWETAGGSPFMLRFEDVKSAELEVKMVVYGYSAYTANRYPNAFALIGGTGLVAPTF